MVSHRPQILLALAFASMGACMPPPEEAGEEGQSQALGGPCGSISGPSEDGDTIPDAMEECLLQRHAPVYHLSNERYLPTNVEWFLARSRLYFRHGNGVCTIHENPTHSTVVDGSIRHQHAHGLASHYGPGISLLSRNAGDNPQYYLGLKNDSSREGSRDARDWRVYGRVSRNGIGGFNVQYWTFFAFSDGYSIDDHEGDWEMVKVQLRPDGKVESIFMAGHGKIRRYSAEFSGWSEGYEPEIFNTGEAHPHVYIAQGTHASYPSAHECTTAERSQKAEKGGFYLEAPTPGCAPHGQTQRWFSWDGASGPGYFGGGIINVGEIDAELNSQAFLNSNVKWGSSGGPTGPFFGRPWDHDDATPFEMSHPIVPEPGDQEPKAPETPESCPSTCGSGKKQLANCACECEVVQTCGANQTWDGIGCQCVE